MAAIALFGVVAYRALPVSDLPHGRLPDDSTSAPACRAAIPGTMASAVASPLERQFTTIAGVDSMTSRAAPGSTQRHAAVRPRARHRQRRRRRADRDRRRDAAAAGGHAVAAVVPQAEPGRSADPACSNLTSNTLPMSVLDDYAETMIAPRISMVNGVSQVQVQGAQKYAVRVQVDPDKLQRAADRHQRSRSGAAELERQPADGPAVRPARRRTTSRPAAS